MQRERGNLVDQWEDCMQVEYTNEDNSHKCKANMSVKWTNEKSVFKMNTPMRNIHTN